MTTDSFHTKFMRAKRQMRLVKDSKNPHFKSTYASLGAVLDVVLPALDAEGLYLQECSKDGQQFAEVGITGGDHVSASLPLACKDPSNPQHLGSAVSYARRYCIMTVCSLHAEDDDGNHAAHSTPPGPAPAQHPTTRNGTGGLDDELNNPNSTTYRERALTLYKEFAATVGEEDAKAIVADCKTHKERCATLSTALDDAAGL
jgi:hypothetical protein